MMIFLGKKIIIFWDIYCQRLKQQTQQLVGVWVKFR